MRLESQNASTTIDLSHSNANFVQNQFSPPSNFRSYQPNSRGCSSIGGRGYHHSGSVNRPLCQTCGKAGHIALKCFHRFDMNFQNSPSFSNGFVGVTTMDSFFLDNRATHQVILIKVLSKLKIKVSSHSNMLLCDACQYGKLHQFSFPSAHTHTLRLSNWYTQMYGALLLNYLVKDTDITSLLWMILLDIFRSSLFCKSLILLQCFFSSIKWLLHNFVPQLNVCKKTGEVSIINFSLFCMI